MKVHFVMFLTDLGQVPTIYVIMLLCHCPYHPVLLSLSVCINSGDIICGMYIGILPSQMHIE